MNKVRNLNPKVVKGLQKKLQEISAENNISQQLIASKSDLVKLAVDNKDTKILTGWRYDIFGKMAENELASKS